MPASIRDQCSVRYFLQCLSPHRSSHWESWHRVPRLRRRHSTVHSTQRWHGTRSRQIIAVYHCISALVLDQLSTAQSRQVRRRLLWNEAGSKEIGSTKFSNRRWLRHQYIRQTKDPWRHPGCHTIVWRTHHNCGKACNYHLRALRHIRRCITQDIASTIACSMVGVESITVMECYL